MTDLPPTTRSLTPGKTQGLAAAVKGKPLSIAQSYIDRGWKPIPIPHRSKKPVLEGWSTLAITAETATDYFNGDKQNIGVLLGLPSGGIVDVDLDDRYARLLGPALLPASTSIFGRKGAPNSHYIYQLSEPDDEPTQQYRDPDVRQDDESSMLVELRATGGQSVFPGSSHKDTGEPIEWSNAFEPMVLDRNDLEKCVRLIAAGALLARPWGKGTRDDLAVNLIGSLLRIGWEPDAVKRYVHAIGIAAGDEKIDSRMERVDNFHQALAAKDGKRLQRVPGHRKLRECLTERVGEQVVAWLGLVQHAAAAGISDDDLALRFAEKHSDDLRYVPAWGKWLRWDGFRFVQDELLSVIDMARAVCREVRDELPEDKRKLVRARLGSSQTIYAVVKLAGGDPRLAVLFHNWTPIHGY